MKKTYGALVVGAGVAGMRSALDLAETGQKVALIDKRPSMGGILTQLDHQFPSDACGMCKMLPLTERDSSSQFCMRKGLFHKNIDIYLHTEMVGLEGDPGKFQATLSQHSTFVDPHKCIGCGACAEVCPVRVPSEFNAGLSERGAVYLPVPHSIPNHYVVDLDDCQRCWQCHEACPTGAIDFKFDERADFHIIVADADPETADTLGGWLEKLGFPLHKAADADALTDMLAGDEKYKMVLLDMGLPGKDPDRVLHRLLELRPDLPVVVMATAEQAGAAHELVQAGAREVRLKPFKKGRFVPWLDKLYMRILSDRKIEMEVGAVILAAGFDCFDPASDDQDAAGVTGYGTLPGVVTSLELERLMSGTGPADRGLTRPDGKPLRRVAWLQCVGSRDIKKKADYCSSICCMISLKEALLLRRKTRQQEGGPPEATIFAMDLRTFGRDFQRYCDSAENDEGVRVVRSRLHSIIPDPEDPNALRVEYVDAEGKLARETFDMLVLAVGARPPKGMDRLAKAAGVDLNRFGFPETRYFAPARTSRLGVFAAGSCGEPRDIAESLIVSGAAALGASRLINIYAPLKEQVAEPEPEYRDVSREAPKMLVALCSSCPVLENKVDMDTLIERLSGLSSVARVARIDSACTSGGWEQIKALAEEMQPNRILIGACQPYAYVPKLRELGAEIGLNPALMDVVDVYTVLAGRENEVDEDRRKALGAQVFSTMKMSCVRLMDADPTPPGKSLPVYRKALVVGGGVAGMTAAMGIADHGYPTVLVEKSENLGGQAARLHYTLSGDDPVHFMAELAEQVEKHPNIEVLTDARVVISMGRAGRFASVISIDGGTRTVEHGVTILATGGEESRIYDYGFRVHKTVVSQRELEEQLASGSLDTAGLSSVAMIQCWRSRDESRNYCSRVCCSQALKNIHMLKKRNPDLSIYVFYRDIMTYGFSEQYYTEARKLGAIFVRYDPSDKPKVEFVDGKPVVTAKDPILNQYIQVEADLLALSTGVEPGDVSELAEMFGVQTTRDGFFQEAETKWRPVDFLKQGVFMCGLARAPGNMSESIASAKAAAQRSLRILSETRLVCGNVVAEVRHSLCSLCGKCIDVCPYDARSLDMVHDKIVVDELLCQGCGSCAAVCPNSASILRGFKDNQVMSAIDAALEETV